MICSCEKLGQAAVCDGCRWKMRAGYVDGMSSLAGGADLHGKVDMVPTLVVYVLNNQRDGQTDSSLGELAGGAQRAKHVSQAPLPCADRKRRQTT